MKFRVCSSFGSHWSGAIAIVAVSLFSMNLQESPVTEGDFRAAVRILADVATMEGTLDQKRVRVMSDSAALIGADYWAWAFAPLMEAGRQPVHLFQSFGGFDDEGISRLIMAIEHPDSGAMTDSLARAMIGSGGQVTRLRQDIIPDERFFNSPAHPLWQAANIGPIIISMRPSPGRGTSVAAFYRSKSAPQFSPREARIAHIVLTEVGWLHDAGAPSSAAYEIPKLSPRCRLILNQLVTGRSRKEIAADLGLSPHTVNDYVKQIFRHFGVHSQAQLISRLRHGDGHDRSSSAQPR